MSGELKAKVIIAPIDSEALDKKLKRFLEATPGIELVHAVQNIGQDKVLITLFYKQKPQ